MPQDYPVKRCDLLIIGGGGAGALAAVEASKHQDLNILLVSKGPIGRSGLTPTANGGTAFHDTPEGTLKEMVTAGSFLNDQSLVWLMANEALTILERLKAFGIGSVPIRAISRCILPSDLLPALRKEILRTGNIELMEDVLITRLVKSNGSVAGAAALDLSTGEFFLIQAKAIVIATGGLVGELYPYTSNNPFGVSTDASGTGHAMAYLAGAEMIDLEMIQFVPLPGHPRCLNLRFYPEFLDGPYLGRQGRLVESDVGAYQGKSYDYRFVRKLFNEMEKGNGPIYIDQRDTPRQHAAFKVKSWNQRRKFISNLEIDPHDNRIEIVIGSHFCMGGIRVNEETASGVPGLFAAGEVIGGVHGGLRLAGYSFTQMIVFGLLAGQHAARYASDHQSFNEIPHKEIHEEKERLLQFLATKKDALSLGEIKSMLQKIMAEQVFVLRDREGLEAAIFAIQGIRGDIQRVSVPNFRRFNLEWMRSIELGMMAEMAEVIARSALARQESRGFHFRRDFPQQDDGNWLKHTVVRRRGDRPNITSEPVLLPHLKPEVVHE